MTAAGTDGEPAARAEGATLSDGGRVLCRNVSLSLPRGGVLVLLGQRPAAGAFLRCLAGRSRTAEGQIRVLGVDPRRRWRLRGRRVFLPDGSALAPLRSRPELLLSDSNEEAPDEFRMWLRESAAAGMAAAFAPARDGWTLDAADRTALFSRGRLVAEGPIGEVLRRFRRIRFVNRLTETRTAFGTELDEFEAVRVRVRGWGIEAVVVNFDDGAFGRLRAVDGVAEAEAEPMTLAEVAEACREGS